MTLIRKAELVGVSHSNKSALGQPCARLRPTGISPVQQVAGYQIGRCLGTGSYGAVFLARSAEAGETRAIKFDQRFKGEQRIRHEAEIGEILGRHENLIEVFEAGEIEGIPYLMMEYFAGETLIELMGRQKDKRFSVDETVSIITQVAKALAYIHSQGYVHRDVKLGNIFIIKSEIDSEYAVKLLDYGFVEKIELSGPDEFGRVFGTPSYMSPEQVLFLQLL